MVWSKSSDGGQGEREKGGGRVQKGEGGERDCIESGGERERGVGVEREREYKKGGERESGVDRESTEWEEGERGWVGGKSMERESKERVGWGGERDRVRKGERETHTQYMRGVGSREKGGGGERHIQYMKGVGSRETFGGVGEGEGRDTHSI